MEKYVRGNPKITEITPLGGLSSSSDNACPKGECTHTIYIHNPQIRNVASNDSGPLLVRFGDTRGHREHKTRRNGYQSKAGSNDSQR
eukprot:COSAG02_NODE_2941_length_7696_cov_10.082533_4_plen_87_part_00